MLLKKTLPILLLSSLLTGALPSGALAAEALRCEGLFTLSAAPALEAKSDGRAFENLTKYEQLFTKGRGIETYKIILGKDFAASFERTLQKSDGHWFDSGAGHAFAVRQALALPEAKHLTSTIVAYDTVAQPTDRLKVISGRFLENIADSEIAKSDLITDVFGPLAYSGQPHVVVQKYLNNLKVGGEMYLFLGARHELFGEANQVITAEGKVLNLAQWLEQIPGAKTEWIRTVKYDDGTPYELWTMKITKENNQEIRVPTVEMVHFHEGAPPTMTFKEVGNRAGDKLAALQEKVRKSLHEQNQNVQVSEFLDAFRGGELRHPLIASIKKLKPEDRWVNFSDVGDSVLQGMLKKDYHYEDTKVFTGLAQKFIRWRASGIKADKLNYTALQDSAPLKDVRDVKLITDYQGDFMSSLMPDVVLNRYLNSLSDKGEIYLYMGKEYESFGSDSVVMTKNGEKYSLRQWLRQIPGMHASLFRGGYHWTGGEWAFLKIKITDRRKIQIPHLKFTGMTETKQGQPVAYFEEI